MIVWDDTDGCYYEIATRWNGTMARQDPEKHSLLGEGWRTKESVLPVQSQDRSRSGHLRDTFNAAPQPDKGTGRKCESCEGFIYGFGALRCGKCRAKKRRVRPAGEYRCGCGKATKGRAQRCDACREAGRSMGKVGALSDIGCKQCGRLMTVRQVARGMKSCEKKSGCKRKGYTQEAA